MAKIAVLGYGTVGSGVVEVLNTNGASIAKRAGDTIEVKSVLDLRDFPGDPIQEKIVHDIDLIINDPEIEVVVEVMGGVEPAFTFVKKALEAGKSVCTSNKALVAAHGPELLEMAKERKLNFMFEASVGGGIPIIRPLNQSLTADEITKITGILNGTTNYILTKMSREGISYQEVLKEAQALGYAERNPEADVEGYDACRKIAILTSLAFGNNKLIIGCANTIIPNVQGSPIIIVVNNENDILLLAVRVSFFVINADTDGTSAVANAILNDNGSVASVSTFPDNIPYCAFATESGKNFFNPFTTVTMSTILDNVDIIALSVIGIETTKILFTILFTLSCL